MSEDPFFDDLISKSPGSSRKNRAPSTDGTQASAADAKSTEGAKLLREETTHDRASMPGPDAAAATTPSLPATTPATPASYMTCKVQPAVQGTELIKPLTYFPLMITVHLPAADDAALRNFSPLPLAPHHRHCTAVCGQRRNRWDGDTTSLIQRRYSEIVELRQLLTLQYPMLIIPPLTPKSKADSFNTYMQSQAHLCQQQRNIARFLRELGRMPEVMLYNDLVPNFFQFPREKISEWMGRIRESIKQLQSANASIEEQRPRKRGAPSNGDPPSTMDSVEDAVANFASEGSKVMRGFVGAFSNWVSAPATGSTAAAAKDRESLQAKAELLFREHPQVQFWTEREEVLQQKRNALTIAADAMMKFIATDDDTNQALQDVADAATQLASTLSVAEPFGKTRDASQGLSSLLADIAERHRLDGERRFTQVYEMMLFEASYMEAMEDAVGFVKCLWHRKLENDLDRFSRPADLQEFRMYVSFVDDRLKNELLINWNRHVVRMRHMMKKSVDIPMQSLLEEEKKTSVHPFIALSRTEAYSAFDA